jgi:hypothetical protein
MAHPLSILAGAGVGAGMMYLFDPNSGRRRRSLVRDQLRHSCLATSKSADVLRRDAGNRLHGLIAEMRHSFNHDRPSDEVLVDRVRSRIGRVVSHPSAIVVGAKDGCVTLSGPVLANEVRSLVSNVRRVLGVQHVVNALDVHQERGNFSALQGGLERHYQPLDILQQSWSPTTRAAVGATAIGLMGACLVNRSFSSIALGTMGFLMAMRAVASHNVAVSSSGGPGPRMRRAADNGSMEERSSENGRQPQSRSKPVQTGLTRESQQTIRQSQTGEPPVFDL